MSERMVPIPFKDLMLWLLEEHRRGGSVFGVHRPYTAGEKSLPIFGGETIETPFGPAAGPNTQLAQNIISAYFAGARFFELKTVQKLDGAELAACISRPCILAEDECYNCEWSTELYVQEAYEEYVKAWCACKMLSRLFSLGQADGFVFNMSVGYDLEGIRGEKIDAYLNGMLDASDAPIFRQCIRTLHELFPEEGAFIDSISPRVSDSVTVSTLHGCPPEEIERIASYLITEKQLHTFVKCNPTLLGYDAAREILDGMGYGYVSFDRHHFQEDLQYADAIPMFRRLAQLAGDNGVEFGLKLSNTFPVEVKNHELPSEEMYMAGRSLFPLTVEMARRISRDLDGRLRLSYSGGADYFNIDRLFACGIWPITMATTELKPGGYQRFTQIARKLDAMPFSPFTRVDADAVARLAADARRDKRHIKADKRQGRQRLPGKAPLLDCSAAPCSGACPIGQDIPAYIELCRQGKYAQSLQMILEKNPLPFITGTICAHRCMGSCQRNFYDSSVRIRQLKLLAAERGCEQVMTQLQPPVPNPDGPRAAIIGGGPTGMAAAYFCARSGIPVIIYEREDSLGGIVRHVIPDFRISSQAIDRDEAILRRMGVQVRLGENAPGISALKAMGYSHILLAVGAWKPGRLDIPGNVKPVIQWLKEAKAGKREPLGHVAVVGGGNTAMDAARLALRLGADSCTLVYRRARRDMPADSEELELALAEGVRLLELLSPIGQENGVLLCKKMIPGPVDESGRRKSVETGEMIALPCDTVISAVGEQVDAQALAALGAEVGADGRPSFALSQPGVYAAGDALRGPATVVEGIADAAAFAAAVAGKAHAARIPVEAEARPDEAIARKGVLCDSARRESDRCLSCSTTCESCADVCPNRANVVIPLPDGRRQILHVDRMCNECGNCAVFCPYESAPYRDKLTLFHDRAAFDGSAENQGFLPLGGTRVLVRLGGSVSEVDVEKPSALPAEIALLIRTVLLFHPYLLQ